MYGDYLELMVFLVKKLRYLIFVVFFVLGFIVVYKLTLPPSQGDQRASLTIRIAPAGSNAKLNGKGIKAGVYKVHPGKYTLSASKSGFASQTTSQDIAAKSTVVMGIALQPNTTSTKDWYNQHPSDQTLAEQVSGNVGFNAGNQILSQTAPIVSVLPIDAGIYKIDYGAPQQGVSKESPTIFISIPDLSGLIAGPVNQNDYDAEQNQTALDSIRARGFNPAQLNIVFLNATNPFVKGGINGNSQ